MSSHVCLCKKKRRKEEKGEFGKERGGWEGGREGGREGGGEERGCRLDLLVVVVLYVRAQRLEQPRRQRIAVAHPVGNEWRRVSSAIALVHGDPALVCVVGRGDGGRGDGGREEGMSE